MKPSWLLPATFFSLPFLVILWALIDEPMPTGKTVQAKVLRCAIGKRRWCTALLDGQPRPVSIFIPGGRTGETRLIAVYRRPISGFTVYEESIVIGKPDGSRPKVLTGP